MRDIFHEVFQREINFILKNVVVRSGKAGRKISVKNNNRKPTQLDLKFWDYIVPRLRSTNQSDGSAKQMKKFALVLCHHLMAP